MISKIDRCRVCDNTELVPVVDLGEQYLTGVFTHKKLNKDLTKGPLRLLKCHGVQDCCGLLQLGHSYDLVELYGESYGYRSGLNPSMVRHLHRSVAAILHMLPLSAGDLIVDIGSNDGTLLSAYPKELNLVGIDPTGEKFRKYYEKHIHLIPEFFSDQLIAQTFPGQKAKVVTSMSMFYDVESPTNFACQVASILDPREGIWVFEQSYMPTMLERTAYDTICHEHLEYYGLAQIKWIANKAGLTIIDVELNDINGGSFSVVAAHRNSIHGQSKASVNQLLLREERAELTRIEPYLSFSDRTEHHRSLITEFFSVVRSEGRRLCGLGASTKGNVLLQYCQLGPNDIESIGDINSDKHGLFTAGTWIPITPEEDVLESDPDYLLVLPWHFRKYFLSEPRYRGRTLVFPLPTIEVIQT